MSASLGWAAGLALTGILVSLTYGSLAAASDGHGFTYWLFLTMLVACNVGAFCVTPYVLVRGTFRRRWPVAYPRAAVLLNEVAGCHSRSPGHHD
ncbi:hypothetical protein P1P75_33210 [Streptomyces sp. ID05-39B]|uniref:hypothetical protein n=1 Tax=Streptomyces sp. ID05-39B TaxID=3028664 RepID=UPI0029A1E45A|nr:hypothetical protein [Streptomyces sp. ID05-39B]MDX3531137.1 hypothetical protein [Streptomyces sp. ID05-39B]